jgi:hypothetical protein
MSSTTKTPHIVPAYNLPENADTVAAEAARSTEAVEAVEAAEEGRMVCRR